MVRMLKVFYFCCGQSSFLFFFVCFDYATSVIGGFIGVIRRREQETEQVVFVYTHVSRALHQIPH